MKLYNTLTRSLEAFKPLAPPTVSMYVCGPTVYDVPHIGHARSAYIFDVLRRYLTFRGYSVKFIRNVTDVDDKIIERAKQELGAGGGGRGAGNIAHTCQEVAERYLKSYHETMDRLGIEPPTEEPHATKHVVPTMTDFISKLLMQGVAYEASGNVYFAVRKFEGYGKLSNRTLDELQAGTRVEPGEGKQDPLDFALWKAAKPGEPQWSSPWGPGRPGWHIECSAMSTKYLGDEFDIHGGGVDLVFPHHENEIAQAQSAGKSFARYWVHNGLLTVNGGKMSKSLGNFVTVEQALRECGDEADVLKMFFLSAHYRSPLDYAPTNLKSASQRLDTFDSLRLRVEAENIKEDMSEAERLLPESEEIAKLRDGFHQAMDEDLNTPAALAILDQLANYGNQCLIQYEKRPLEKARLKEWDRLPMRAVQSADAIVELGQVLGLFAEQPFQPTPEQQARVREREEARKRKDFKTADRIRKELEVMGLSVEDTDKGPLVRRKR